MAVHRRRSADGAVRGDHPAQGLRVGRDGDGRGLFSRPGVHCCLAGPVERQNLFDKLVEAAYQHGKALTSATTFELDDVIDPADSRAWITRLLLRG